MTYPIIEIDSDWILEQEHLGSKDKYWVKNEGHEVLKERDWLFKFPKARVKEDGDKRMSGHQLKLQEITGMHWSEKIAYELTRELEILSPKVELAILNGNIGSITENFVAEYTLYHGNQVLANANPEYAPDKTHHQNDHKMSTIMESIGDIFADRDAGDTAKQKFIDYLVFDALICNVDRHHENWGFLRKLTKEGDYYGSLAPSYDHASSLGRELIEKNEQDPNKKSFHSLLRDPKGIKRYVMVGHGPIYVEGTGKKGPSPIRLVQRCLELDEFASYFKQSLNRLERIDVKNCKAIIEKIPDEHMTPLAKDFAYQLLCVTLQLLNELRD